MRASERRYRELYENVVVGVFQTTPDGKFTAANLALVRLLGYASEDELLALNIGEDLYVHAEDRANWLRNMAAAGEIRNAELVLRRKDGRKIVVLENSRAVRDESGRILYYEGTLTDINDTCGHVASDEFGLLLHDCSITEIGHVMGKKAVAESVENPAVLARLKSAPTLRHLTDR